MRLLLHLCCGPCLSGVMEALKEEDVQIAGYWYNPNIHPYLEYQRRLMTAGFVGNKFTVPLLIREPDFSGFLAGLVRAQAEGERCRFCWYQRLERTALAAKDGNYDGFTTTLLASPHQNHEVLKETGTRIAEEVKIPFFYRDFRTGYKEAKNSGRRMGLYHQNYCGCLYSEWERHNVTAEEK